jgi:hypothetical protein
MGLEKNDCNGDWGKVVDIIGKVIGAGQPAICVVFFSDSFIRGSHVYYVSVFLNIPALGLWLGLRLGLWLDLYLGLW